MASFNLVPGGGGQNYTGFLTRSIVFSGALIAFLASTGLTLASIIVPNWISFENHTHHHTHIHYTYGLHRRCSSTNIHLTTSPSSPFTNYEHLTCVPFPRSAECHGDERYFCSMWKSMAFLMSLGVVFEGMAIAAFLILLVGGKQRREQGWGVLSIMVAIAAVVQAAGMSLTAYLFEKDPRFFVGWFLDKSWVMCTVSWSVQAMCAIAITTAALTLPTEGGYELIPDHA